MLQNKMEAAKLGFEIYALTTIPERADVGDGSGVGMGTLEFRICRIRIRVISDPNPAVLSDFWVRKYFLQ